MQTLQPHPAHVRPVFNDDAPMSAARHPQRLHPMLPPSPRGLSPLPIHSSLEEVHEIRALAAFRLQAVAPSMARSSALDVSSPRKRKAESQDPGEQVGMPDPGTEQATPVDPALARAQDRRMWDRLSHALRHERVTSMVARLGELLRRSNRLDQPNTDLMCLLAMEAKGPRMSLGDLEAIFRSTVRLRNEAGWQNEVAVLELCYGLAKALHAPRLQPAHAQVIEQVLAGSGLPLLRQAEILDVMHLRRRPCGSALSPDSTEGSVDRKARSHDEVPAGGEAAKRAEHKADEIRAAKTLLPAGPPGCDLVDALVEEILELDLDLPSDWLRESDGKRSTGLDDAIKRWLTPARQAGQAALDKALGDAIRNVCQDGHRLGHHARQTLRYLVGVAGGPSLSAAHFGKILGRIVDHQGDRQTAPSRQDTQSSEGFSPVESLAYGLGQAVSEKLRPGGRPLLTSNKHLAAREVLRGRPGLPPALAQRLAQVLGLKEPLAAPGKPTVRSGDEVPAARAGES